MAHLFSLPTKTDARGSLTVIENALPFRIERVFYLHGLNPAEERGGHRHKATRQAMICLRGSCEVYNNDGREERIYALNSPDQCLILEPEDWHTMRKFEGDPILLVLASHAYDPKDYIVEAYR